MTSDIKCPVCGSKARLRTSKKDGSKFHVCVNYPQCKGKVSFDEEWDDDFEGEKPAKKVKRAIFTCPFCSNEGPPIITKQVNAMGWVLFVILLLLFFPLCWLPFVISGCKDEIRKCAVCGGRIG